MREEVQLISSVSDEEVRANLTRALRANSDQYADDAQVSPYEAASGRSAALIPATATLLLMGIALVFARSIVNHEKDGSLLTKESMGAIGLGLMTVGRSISIVLSVGETLTRARHKKATRRRPRAECPSCHIGTLG